MPEFYHTLLHKSTDHTSMYRYRYIKNTPLDIDYTAHTGESAGTVGQSIRCPAERRNGPDVSKGTSVLSHHAPAVGQREKAGIPVLLVSLDAPRKDAGGRFSDLTAT